MTIVDYYPMLVQNKYTCDKTGCICADASFCEGSYDTSTVENFTNYKTGSMAIFELPICCIRNGLICVEVFLCLMILL